MRKQITHGLTLGMLVAGAVGLHAQTAVKAPAPPERPVTFARDVAPIFQDKCQQCHRPGQMAPMSLLTYQDVRPWVRSIKTKLVNREMPPWYLDQNVGIQQFQNDYSITEEQRTTIVTWVDQGAPLGNPADLPAARTWRDEKGFRLTERFGRDPDLIIRATPWKVAAQGQDQWWQPVIDTGLTEDRWIRGIEMLPSDRRVVHHAGTLLYQDEDTATIEAENKLRGGQGTVEQLIEAMNHPSGKLVPSSEGAPAVLSEWAVGKEGEIYSENTGKLIKKGAKIAFDIHYHAVGEDVTDQLQMAFWFYPKGYVPKRVVRWMMIGSVREIQIPPNVQTVHHGYSTLPAAAILQNFQPHMHLRGKAFTLEAIYPDGRREILNHADKFRFNWSINYVYADSAAPLLPKGTVLHVMGWHDNTPQNRDNPDPNQWVVSGGRTVDEMIHNNSQVVYLTEADFQQLVAERKKASQAGATSNQ